jgi:hypothetical protein
MGIPTSIGISFGAFAPSLDAQVAEQGLAISDATVLEKLERARTSLAYLYIHGFVAESEAERARKRLMRAIVKAVTPIQETATCETSTTS